MKPVSLKPARRTTVTVPAPTPTPGAQTLARELLASQSAWVPQGQTGRVLRLEEPAAGGPIWWVEHAQGVSPAPARCAASCLVQAAPGDVVLLAQADGQWWITAVLALAAPHSVALSVPGVQQLVLKAPQLRLQAQAVQVDTELLDVRAATVQAVVTALQLVAQTLTTMAQRIATLGDHISNVCRSRVVQVDEMDALSARHIDVKAQDTYSQHAGQMLVTARETVRVDGERILMG